MKPPRQLLVLASLAVLAAAITPTIRVQWERGSDFSKYHTYSWVAGQAAVDPEVGRLIRDTVANELAARGIFADEQDPDLHVAYYASAKEEVVISGGYSPDWTSAEPVTVKRFLAGTLVIDLVDVSQNRLVWRATANATVSGDPKKSRHLVPGVVEKMFADFPPQS